MPTTITQEFILALKEQDKIDFIKTLIAQFAPSMSAGDVTKLANITISSPVNLNVMLTDIASKVDKVAGKNLSEEDFTTALKTKLSTLEGSHFKGSHPDEAALLAAHPTSEAGGYAYVLMHNTEHHFIWDYANSAWTDAGAAGATHLTDSQIKTQYEANIDTNVFDDIAKARVAENRYYLDLREEQVLGFNGMYAGVSIKKDGYVVNSTAQGDTGVFVGTYISDQDVGGGAEAKILLGTVYLDSLGQKQGVIYVYLAGSMSFVEKAIDPVAIKTAYESNGNTYVFDGATQALVASALQSHQDITGKVDVVAGMGLSTNDFSTAEQDKLATMVGSHFKGVHVDLAALELAFPAANAEDGSYAYLSDGVNPEVFVILDHAIATPVWEAQVAAIPTVPLTEAEIKTLYEANPQTNAFDDAAKTKLAGLNDIVTSVTQSNETRISQIVSIAKADHDTLVTLGTTVADKLYEIV